MKTGLLGAAIILALMAVVVPAVIGELERSAQAADGEPSGSRALAVARLATEAGARELAAEGVWARVQRGEVPPGFDLDAAFSEEPGTRYAVRLASGPAAGQVSITGVGQDVRRGQVRALKIVYELQPSSALQPVDCRWENGPRCDR